MNATCKVANVVKTMRPVLVQSSFASLEAHPSPVSMSPIQRVNLRAHAISECQINQLMLLYLIFAGKLLAHNDRFEVLAVIALHFYVIAGQAIDDVVS